MNRFHLGLVCLAAASLCNAAIITRSFEVLEDQLIDIDDSTVHFLSDRQLPSDQKSDSLKKMLCLNPFMDLAYTLLGLWDDFDCGCGGKIYGMVSSRSLYLIDTSSTTFFANPLDTADDELYLKRVHSTYPCKTWSTPQLLYLPDGICGNCTLNVDQKKEYWYLGKTDKNHFFLYQYDIGSSIEPVVAKAKITCIIQTDGSLDFSKAFQSPVIRSANKRQKTDYQKSVYRKILSPKNIGGNSVLYNIQGTKVIRSKSGTSHGNSIRLYITGEK